MEPVSAVSAVVGIVVPAAGIAKLAGTLYSDLKDAPENLSELRRRILVWKRILGDLASLERESGISDTEREALNEIANSVKRALEVLKTKAAKLPSTTGKRATIKWAFLKRRTIRDLEAELQTQQTHLLTILALKN